MANMNLNNCVVMILLQLETQAVKSTKKIFLQSSEMEENFVNLLNFASNTGSPVSAASFSAVTAKVQFPNDTR